MKRSILLKAFLMSLVIVVSISCSNSRIASKRGDYPIVKKIKNQNGFHTDFRWSGRKNITKSKLADHKKEDLQGDPVADLIPVKQNSPGKQELSSTGSMSPPKLKRVVSLSEKKDSLAMMEDEELLASLNENTLEHVILKKTLEKVKKRYDYLGDPTSKKRSPVGFAITSFILGVVGLFFASLPMGTLAIIFAMVAFTRYSKYGGKMKGFAIAGLILGLIDVVVMLIALVVA